MGRITEFIYYINLEHEPTPLEKMAEYTSLAFTSNVIDARKEYKKSRQKYLKTKRGTK